MNRMDIYLKCLPDYFSLVSLGICWYNFNEFFKVYETIAWMKWADKYCEK